MTTSHTLPGSTGANTYKILSWEVDERGAGEWDVLSLTYEGCWSDPEAARRALRGKRIALDGLETGYGFYTTDGGVKARWGKQGRVVAEVTALGLFERKLKRTDFSELDSYALNGVAVSGLAPALANGTYERLNFTWAKPQVEIVAAHLVTGSDYLDLTKVGRPVSAHWAITATGGWPPVGTNPFTAGDFTWHYPNGWAFTVEPGQRLGAWGSSGYKLMIARYKFWHQWPKTL